MCKTSVHGGHKLVNVLFAIARITTLRVMLGLLSETSKGGRQLEGPQEVRSLLEAGAASDDLVNQILNADDAMVTQIVRHHRVVSERNSLSKDLAKATLVDQIRHSLDSWGPVCDEWLNQVNHVHGGLVNPNEDGIVHLAQSKELRDLSDFRRYTVDTTNSDHQQNLCLRGNIKVAVVFGLALERNLLAFASSVLFDVGLSTLEDYFSLRMSELSFLGALLLSRGFDCVDGLSSF